LFLETKNKVRSVSNMAGGFTFFLPEVRGTWRRRRCGFCALRYAIIPSSGCGSSGYILLWPLVAVEMLASWLFMVSRDVVECDQETKILFIYQHLSFFDLCFL
jgi:hypothetical protein